MQEVIATGQSRNHLHKHPIGDERRYVDVLLSPVRDMDGKITHVLEAARDVTDLLEARTALKAQEAQIRSILEVADEVAIVVTDVSGEDSRILEFSRGAEKIFGYTRREILGRPVSILHLDEEFEEMRRELDAGRSGFRGESTLVRKSGERFPALFTNHPIRDSAGKITSALSVSIDITERKRAEEERLKLERQVLHSKKLESLGVLAGGIAHDFNNLLMAIIGHADLALDDLPTSSSARESLHEIEIAANRAAELSRQMLAYTGRGRVSVTSLDLNDTIREMESLLKVSLPRKAEIAFDLDPKISVVEGDASQLRQVIMNLVSNAGEAIGDDQGTVHITTTEKSADPAEMRRTGQAMTARGEEALPGANRYISLKVTDTGCGMDPLVIEKIFDPFFSTKFTGRGLGLASVLGIVRGHQGALLVNSEPQKGTTVEVLLPSTSLRRFDAPTKPRRRESPPPWPSGARVLVVDDEESVRAVTGQMLQRLGFTVELAGDGYEAIELFKKIGDQISFVLLDMTMRRLSGEETFAELRRLREDVKVILCSGYNEQEAMSRFEGRGLAGFIQKPYKLPRLEAMLRRALSS